jgi:hypothetical protein
MSAKQSLSADEKAFGERLKATKVAICEFLAEHPSTVTDPNSLMEAAASVAAYPISSRRHVLAMESELNSTVRELSRQVSLKYWSRAKYDDLVAHLRTRNLIDISAWTDRDNLRIRGLLERGELRTASEYRLAIEYRDTIEDRETIGRLDAIVTAYEARRGQRFAALSPQTSMVKPTSALSSEDLEYADTLRRTAIESLEYAARHGRGGKRGASAMKDRADAWRSLPVVSRRDLHDLEHAFWVVLAKLRRNRLSPDQFETLAAQLKEKGLIDISRVADKPRPR